MRILSNLRSLQLLGAFLLFCGLGGTVGSALALEHIGGFVPCELCLLERVPYYIGLGLLALAFFTVLCGFSPKFAAALFLCVALLMLYDAGLSLYHVGVELKYWPGPVSCSSPSLANLPAQASSLLENLNKTRITPCNVPAGYIFGISFAGWGCIAAVIFTCCAAFAAYFPFYARRKYG